MKFGYTHQTGLALVVSLFAFGAFADDHSKAEHAMQAKHASVHSG